MPILEMEGLTRRYGRRRGIESVTLSVEEGRIFGFLGPNGAGKTTAIRLLLGFLRPTAGSARVFGRDAWRESRVVKAEVGYLPGDVRIYSWLTGREALSLSSRVRRRDALAGGRALADEFSLDLSVPVRAMSRGMRQKLGLILAMAHSPRLLILDEPTSALDPLMQATLHDRLRRFASSGCTIFFSSHTLSEVEQLCSRVAIIREGRIAADESLADLRARSGRKVVIRFADSVEGLATPEFLDLDRRESLEWSGVLRGPVEALLEWLRGRRVEDLVLEPPDLETLFRRFYGRGDVP